MSNKLGEKIKEIRLEQGMSQEEFAKELGYTSKSTINKIEKGVNDISYDKLELLIQKFDLEVNELFDNLAKDMGTKVISEDRTERVDEDYLDAKDIIKKAEEANLIDDILFAVYGIIKPIFYVNGAFVLPVIAISVVVFALMFIKKLKKLHPAFWLVLGAVAGILLKL